MLRSDEQIQIFRASHAPELFTVRRGVIAKALRLKSQAKRIRRDFQQQ
jgi:hypothetical protein